MAATRAQTLRLRRLALPQAPAISAEQALLAVGVLILGYLVLGPLLILVATSLHQVDSSDPFALTLENFSGILSHASGVTLVWNSLVYAVGSAAIAIVLGGVLAWLVERTDAPLRSTTYLAMFLSIALPGIFKVIGWIILLGPRAGYFNLLLGRLLGGDAAINLFSLGGMIFVEGLMWTPTAFLLMGAPLRLMDPSLEEAAQMSGASRWQTFRRVTIPLMAPACLAVGLLAIVRMLEAFEVPALLGIPGRSLVLSSQIYIAMRTGIVTSYEEPSAYAVLLIVPVVAGLLLYRRVVAHAERYQVVTGKGFRPARTILGRWWGAATGLMVLVMLLMVLPLLALLWTSLLPFAMAPSPEAFGRLTLGNYAQLAVAPRLIDALGNTLVVSVAAASAVMVLVTVCAWLVNRTRLRGRAVLDYLTIAPLAFPGLVLGVALLTIYLRVPVPIYNTLAILIVALSTRFVPFGMRYASAGLLQIGSELEESGAVSGGPWLQVFARVTVPLILPALFAGWVFVFLHAATELSASVLLSGPRSQVAAVLLFQLWQEGSVNQIGAFSVVFSIPLVVIALALRRATARYGLVV